MKDFRNEYFNGKGVGMVLVVLRGSLLQNWRVEAKKSDQQNFLKNWVSLHIGYNDINQN